MEKTLTIKKHYGALKISDLDADREIEITIEDQNGKEMNIYLSPADLTSMGGHLLYLGKKIASGK